MDRETAIPQIQEACKNISLQLMKIHPLVPGLQDADTQSKVLTSAHALTVEVEAIKKALLRLQQRESAEE